MFPARYFPNRYYAPRYFPNLGGVLSALFIEIALTGYRSNYFTGTGFSSNEAPLSGFARISTD